MNKPLLDVEIFVEAMRGIWWNAGEEYEAACRPLFIKAIKAFADTRCGIRCHAFVPGPRQFIEKHAAHIAELTNMVFSNHERSPNEF